MQLIITVTWRGTRNTLSICLLTCALGGREGGGGGGHESLAHQFGEVIKFVVFSWCRTTKVSHIKQ